VRGRCQPGRKVGGIDSARACAQGRRAESRISCSSLFSEFGPVAEHLERQSGRLAGAGMAGSKCARGLASESAPEPLTSLLGLRLHLACSF